MKRLLLVPMVLTLATSVALLAGDATYIGVGKCKICHKVEYTSWKGMKHAQAFEALKPEEQAKPECLRCHATGGSAEMPGVQCEACHGPGSGYKSIRVMKNADAARAAGLVLPDEETCKRCHENAPHDQPPFDFEAAKERGLHARKKDVD